MTIRVRYPAPDFEVCPAGWKVGDKGMKETSTGVADYLKEPANEL